ncbi:unnamed protein product [Lactuca virosa]|uniref:ABC-type xenobiotic transporter n=1 Tax=Lactuca virosa TaxID=75947 RepID=A0AAU9NC22_9ASTR|nr:unnamed protein product [Lactuca virosa]
MHPPPSLQVTGDIRSTKGSHSELRRRRSWLRCITEKNGEEEVATLAANSSSDRTKEGEEKSTTPEPQVVARLTNPCIPAAGGRVNSAPSEHSDLAAGMSLSSDGLTNLENEIEGALCKRSGKFSWRSLVKDVKKLKEFCANERSLLWAYGGHSYSPSSVEIYRKQQQLVNLCHSIWIKNINLQELAYKGYIEAAVATNPELRFLAMQGVCMSAFVMSKVDDDDNDILNQLEEMYQVLSSKFHYEKDKMERNVGSNDHASLFGALSSCCIMNPNMLCLLSGFKCWLDTLPLNDNNSFGLDMRLLQELSNIITLDGKDLESGLSRLRWLLESTLKFSLNSSSRPPTDFSPYREKKNSSQHGNADLVPDMLFQPVATQALDKILYRPNAPLVLKGINCTFEEGRRVGIVGRTGSGKTTLITTLFRLVEADSGRILIDGLDISSIGLKDLRIKLSVIPQETTLFKGSIRTNLDPLGLHSDGDIWKKIIRDEFLTCTVITVAHRVPTVIDSDKVMVLSFGKMVEYDEPLKLMETTDSFFSKLVAEYWSSCTARNSA